jgi:hypothetical protein
MSDRTKIKQCRTCPWKVSCSPEEDIPNYSLELAKALRSTISDGSITGLAEQERRIMACHYSEQGNDITCAGWLHNQLGHGNNLGVRMDVIRGRLPAPEVDGKQHDNYEDTLPLN